MSKLYVIHKHSAKHLHYDLRLEHDGVLKSWAVPKEPSPNPSIKRLAVQVEDHTLEYGKFEGDIPEGEYGAGKVEIWDTGTYKTIEWSDNKIIFDISGKVLTGVWCLIKLKKVENDKNWLFFKKK